MIGLKQLLDLDALGVSINTQYGTELMFSLYIIQWSFLGWKIGCNLTKGSKIILKYAFFAIKKKIFLPTVRKLASQNIDSANFFQKTNKLEIQQITFSSFSWSHNINNNEQ